MMLQIEFSNLTAAAATTAMLAALQPAKGAVRVCKEPVSSVIVFEESEKDSKRRALNDWKMKAGLFGGDTRAGAWRPTSIWHAPLLKVKDMRVLRVVLRARSSRCRRSRATAPSRFRADARCPPTPAKINRCNGQTKA